MAEADRLRLQNRVQADYDGFGYAPLFVPDLNAVAAVGQDVAEASAAAQTAASTAAANVQAATAASAATATTQAGIATTQAGIATTQAASATLSASQALQARDEALVALGALTYRGFTAGAQPRVLTRDGTFGGEVFIVPQNNTAEMRFFVVARQSGGTAGSVGDRAAWELRVSARRGSTFASIEYIGGRAAGEDFQPFAAGDAIAPDASRVVGGGSAWRVAVSVDAGSGGVRLRVTAAAGVHVEWLAQLDVTVLPVVTQQQGVVFASALASPQISADGTFLRAQTAGIEATFLGADGVTWETAGADVPRFVGANRALLFESGGTNNIANSRAEGAVSPSTPPTSWVLVTGIAGVTITIAPFTDGIITGAELDISGSGTGIAQIQFGSLTSVAASAGQAWVASVFHQLVSGTLANLTLTFGIRQGAAGGVFVADSTPTVLTPNTSALGTQRAVNILASAEAGTQFVMSRVFIAAAGAVSARLRFAWPDLKQQSFLTNPILPPVSAPAISAIGADRLSAPLSSLGIAPNGASTWWFDFEMLAPVGSRVSILCIDDNSPSNRITFERSVGGVGQIVRNTATVQSSANIGSISSSVKYGAAVTLRGDGSVRAVIHSLGNAEVTGAPTSGLITSRHNGISSGIHSGNFRMRRSAYLPFAVDNPTLDSLAAQAAAW